MSSTVLWIIAGTAFCMMEVFVPTAFAEFALGVSAFIVALISLVIPQLGIQIALWMLLSTALVVLSKRFFKPSRRQQLSLDATEATTLTEILPGKAGRVIYEGNSWQARCNDDTIAIAPDQAVYVVGRQGTTLLIMPMMLPNSLQPPLP